MGQGGLSGERRGYGRDDAMTRGSWLRDGWPQVRGGSEVIYGFFVTSLAAL